MEDQIELLFRISQPSDIQQSNSHLPTSTTMDPGNGTDPDFWEEVGLKCYNSHYGNRYSQTDVGGQSPPVRSPTVLQLVNILRLTVDCPDPEVRGEAAKVLQEVQERGISVPKPLFFCPSRFIPPIQCPKLVAGNRCGSSSVSASSCATHDQTGATTNFTVKNTDAIDSCSEVSQAPINSTIRPSQCDTATPCPGTTASTPAFNQEPSNEAEGSLLPGSVDTGEESESRPVVTSEESSGDLQMTPGGYFALYEPEYPKYNNGSVMQWTELTSRIFYGDQTELAVDGTLTDSQMRDLYNYSIGVGHYGFDARLLSEAFLSSGRIDHAIQLMAYHEDYLEVFLRTHHFLLRGDGPLPFIFRHYIAIMAAARFQCTYLMELQKREFLYQGGDPQWLKGLEFAPQKLTSLYHINKMMAHRPWALKKEDFLYLTKKAGLSLSEVVHAVVLLAHFHSLSSFIHGCGITPEVDFDKGHAHMDPGTFNVIGNGSSASTLPGNGTTFGLGTDSISAPASLGDHGSSVSSSPINKIDKTDNSASPTNKSTVGLLKATQINSNPTAVSVPTSPTTNATASPTPARKAASEVELLMATMKNLAETTPIEDPEEKKKRFETVASADDTHEKENFVSGATGVSSMLPPEVSPFVNDPDFSYEDFAKRGQVADMHTFRIQDYSWEEHGYSLVNRLYADVGGYLDEKFKVAQSMTYYTMGGRPHVDTTKFRTAVWNYIQCLYGIRHDDYDYGEINQLLERPLKGYIKTVCCYPERVTKADYDNVMREFKHSEKVHVNLMIMEAKIQAELLYALRTIMRFIL